MNTKYLVYSVSVSIVHSSFMICDFFYKGQQVVNNVVEYVETYWNFMRNLKVSIDEWNIFRRTMFLQLHKTLFIIQFT